jgi:hypothetical protein
VLGHVDRRSAILAAEREALEQADEDQQNRREQADGVVRGQEADQRGRSTHERDGHQERELAADEVADAAEEHGTEWTYRESCAERCKGGEERRDLIALRVELRREERRQHSVEIEVVPLDGRSGG